MSLKKQAFLTFAYIGMMFGIFLAGGGWHVI